MDKKTEDLKNDVKRYLEDSRVEYEENLGKKFLELSKEYDNIKEKMESLEKYNDYLEWENIKLSKYNEILKSIVEKVCYVKLELIEPDE